MRTDATFPANLTPDERRVELARLFYMSTTKITIREAAAFFHCDKSTISRDRKSDAYRQEVGAIREVIRAEIYTDAWKIIDLDGLKSRRTATRLATAKWVVSQFNLVTLPDDTPPWDK